MRKFVPVTLDPATTPAKTKEILRQVVQANDAVLGGSYIWNQSRTVPQSNPPKGGEFASATGQQ